jgi:hypothetical protein
MRVLLGQSVLAVACLGAVLLVGAGTARAAAATVTFQGGCGLLGVGASSRPDPDSLSVPAGTPVTFVNRLGEPAELMINGADRGTVTADHQVAVTFEAGRVDVSLVPGCLLGTGGAVPATITVSVSPSPGPPAGTGSPATRRSPDPGTTSGGGGSQPSAGRRATTQAGPAAAPAVKGSPAVPTTDPAAALGSALPDRPVRRGPSGLLVSVAAICALGVTAAAVRAIISRWRDRNPAAPF